MQWDFGHLFPGARTWVDGLASFPGIKQANETDWVFAVVEAFHLLFLAMLGGAVIVLNTRLMGAGITSEPPSEVERRTRLWLNIGTAGVLLTGVVIGMMNAAKLYDSSAFFVKMVALVAGVVFSFFVTNRVAQNEGVARPAQLAGAGLGLLLWLFGVFVFTSTVGTDPGAVHIVTAGVLLLIAASPRFRWPLAGGVAVLFLIGWVVTHFVLQAPVEPNPETATDADFDAFIAASDAYTAAVKSANIWFVRLIALVTLAVAVLELAVPARNSTDAERTPPQMGRVIGFVSILVWVTVAAAGRWIGFS